MIQDLATQPPAVPAALLDTPWYHQPLGLHVILALAMLWPLTRLLWRARLSPLWALLVFIPVLGLPLVGAVLAIRPWPMLDLGTWTRRRQNAAASES